MKMDIDDKIKLALQECGGIWRYDIDNKFKEILPVDVRPFVFKVYLEL